METRGLRAISDGAWDTAGVVCGAMGATAIAYQILHEWQTPGPSTVSLWFILGFLVIYVFWFLYGVRFGRRGIWLSNAVAAALQLVFAAVVVAKG